MYHVELVNRNTEDLRHSDYHHYDLQDGETTYCRIFISEELNNIIKAYIPSGIELFHHSIAKTVKPAISELYDRMSSRCQEDFNYKKCKLATLANAVYAIKQMKIWCDTCEYSMFKVRRGCVEDPIT